MRAAARKLSYDPAYLSRICSGKQAPSVQFARDLGKLLGMGDELVAAATATLGATMLPLGLGLGLGVRDDELAQTIRTTSQQLVTLDNQGAGAAIAPLAARAYKAVRPRLTGAESDVLAAAAELAEVTGWLFFDAARIKAARAYTEAALALAQEADDRSIELLILQNLAMIEGWEGNLDEELNISAAMLDARLPPRVEAMFEMRAARALVGRGDIREGTYRFDRARGGSSSAADPSWVWWLDRREIDASRGSALLLAGRHHEALGWLRLGTDMRGSAVRISVTSALRASSLVTVQAWSDLEELAIGMHGMAHVVCSERARNLLLNVIERGTQQAPDPARDALAHLREILWDDELI